MSGVGVPAGLAGGVGDSGDVGDERKNFNSMVAGMGRWREISDNVEGDQLNIEKYGTELANVCVEMFRSTSAMFEQQCLRVIDMFTCPPRPGAGEPTEEVTGTPRASWSTKSSRTCER